MHGQHGQREDIVILHPRIKDVPRESRPASSCGIDLTEPSKICGCNEDHSVFREHCIVEGGD